MVIKIGSTNYMFGAHNDAQWRHQGGQSDMSPGPDLEIIRLIKFSGQVFFSLSKNGALRKWEMSLQPIMQRQQQQPQGQPFGGGGAPQQFGGGGAPTQ